MIQYLNRIQLDKKKYDNCISNDVNTRIYAYSWYLDIVCDNWDVLVEDDYQSVMPLPTRKKYGIHYIYLPPWSQQLGIFSIKKINESKVTQFIKKIPGKFKLVDIFFNSGNKISSHRIKLRENYVLPLDKPYEIIKKNYGKGRKSSLKRSLTYNLEIVENYDHIKIIELFKQNKGVELSKIYSDYDVLRKLMEYVLQNNHAKTFAVLNANKELIGGAFFLMDNRRITYLFSAINNEAREKQAMTFLIDFIIQKNAESKYILDFEGSVIKELASFFKSFGAHKEEYFNLRRKQFF